METKEQSWFSLFAELHRHRAVSKTILVIEDDGWVWPLRPQKVKACFALWDGGRVFKKGVVGIWDLVGFDSPAAGALRLVHLSGVGVHMCGNLHHSTPAQGAW